MKFVQYVPVANNTMSERTAVIEGDKGHAKTDLQSEKWTYQPNTSSKFIKMLSTDSYWRKNDCSILDLEYVDIALPTLLDANTSDYSLTALKYIQLQAGACNWPMILRRNFSNDAAVILACCVHLAGIIAYFVK